MPRPKLPVHRFKGTATKVGEAYGEAFETQIMGFIYQELKPDKKRLAYAARCWKHVQKSAPASARFMKGMARGAKLSIEHITLLTLHEEIYHEPHCTGFSAAGDATRDGKTYVGMNWDWNTNLHPWAQLLRLDIKGDPRVATYAFPGLWTGAGVNEHGMAFMWTGSGYTPPLHGIVGVPTYVLIAEILRRKTVPAVIRYLQSVTNAGAFIFFIGDASGRIALIEGVPGGIEVVEHSTTLSRANHYECKDTIRCAKQKPTRRKGWTSPRRAERMAEMMTENEGRISVAAAKRILHDRTDPWPYVHQIPSGPTEHELRVMTIDSLFAVCEDRVLWTSRGGRQPGPWQCVEP